MQRMFFTYSLIGFSKVNQGVIRRTLLNNPVGVESQLVPLEHLPTIVFFDMDSLEGQEVFSRLQGHVRNTTLFVSIALDHHNFDSPYKLNKFAYPSKLITFLRHLTIKYPTLLGTKALYSRAELNDQMLSLQLDNYQVEASILADLNVELLNLESDVQFINEHLTAKTILSISEQLKPS